ncbi:MAG: hypothetical protein N2484_10485 [Clostridia bacterium]|nr:hypothetical protein [Clostridia bacterium]
MKEIEIRKEICKRKEELYLMLKDRDEANYNDLIKKSEELDRLIYDLLRKECVKNKT